MFCQWCGSEPEEGGSDFTADRHSERNMLEEAAQMNNRTAVQVFSLTGFNVTSNYRGLFFCLTLLCGCLTVTANLTLIFTIIADKSLHKPMYIFLCSLCVNGLYGTSGFYPKFASDLLSDVHEISYEGCLLQVFIIYSSAATDYSILVFMAYDRYVAVCRPLHYHSMMSARRTTVLLCLSWLVPFCCLAMVLTLTSRLDLCGSTIDKLYCENWSIVKLACGSTEVNSITGLIVVFFYIGHTVCIASSYVRLVRFSLRTRECRKKFIQTCLPHLLCLFCVTATLVFDIMYTRYGSVSVPQHLRNFMAIQFVIITPAVNPIIYGLNLTKIRSKIKGYICLSN